MRSLCVRFLKKLLLMSLLPFTYLTKDLQIVPGLQCGRLYMAYNSVP